MSTQERLDQGLVISALKKVKPTAGERLIHDRVVSWVSYYRGNKKLALQDARKILIELKDHDNLYKDIRRDIEIFESELTSDLIENTQDIVTK